MTLQACFEVLLLSATLLSTLVTGLLVAFAVVVMPGLATLGDREFLHAFQVVDRVIQRRQPVFMILWLGSVGSLAVALGLGWLALDGAGRWLLLLAGLVYFAGVQGPTVAVNLPLNRRIQTLRTETLDVPMQRTERLSFEPRWNRYNRIRAALGVVSCALLSVVLAMV